MSVCRTCGFIEDEGCVTGNELHVHNAVTEKEFIDLWDTIKPSSLMRERSISYRTSLSVLQFYCCQWRIVLAMYLEKWHYSLLHLTVRNLSHSHSYFTTGDLPPISSSWRQAPSRHTTRVHFFLQLNPSGHSSYVTSSLRRRWVCLLWTGFVFIKCTYRTCSMLLDILPCALYTSPLSVQALESKSSWSTN
jgi:hypothetical protein